MILLLARRQIGTGVVLPREPGWETVYNHKIEEDKEAILITKIDVEKGSYVVWKQKDSLYVRMAFVTAII